MNIIKTTVCFGLHGVQFSAAADEDEHTNEPPVCSTTQYFECEQLSAGLHNCGCVVIEI